MKELKFEELSVRQKLGMVFTPFLNSWAKSEPDEEFVLSLIKERALGSVWIQQGYRDAEKMLKMVKELADYPIIIMTGTVACDSLILTINSSLLNFSFMSTSSSYNFLFLFFFRFLFHLFFEFLKYFTYTSSFLIL